jgi:endonuclease III
MNQKVIKHIIKEELNKSDEAKIKKLARDEFDKMIKKHLSGSQLEDKVKEIVLQNLKKHKPTQKEVASITKEVLVKLYKTLWTRKNFWSNGLENI